MDVQTASNVRARVLRSKVLSLAKTCSIGLKSAAPGGCQDSCRIKLDAQASQSDVDADHGCLQPHALTRKNLSAGGVRGEKCK